MSSSLPTPQEIRDLRMAARLSQVELAQLTGLSRNTVQAAEQGRLTTRTARALGCVLRELQVPSDRLTQVERQLADLTAQVEQLARGAA
ncbi:hypothetical protein GCM10022243_49300 [Saccharothrix violaceirubra]|uniref:Transcriptional regulator with XRE-family HTH domain n=1 Tax=Saccharothrix violaceirubra TaxID=413306 RepID=A0A7W7SZB5_9PSEU|nr:helix-turn-helix transcriptional regulator [Saccharothrix violaceirubra]MBB4963726.1 transcriptional regulator with XRE-family HTH domain [Saccharothrix violaceirubra]